MIIEFQKIQNMENSFGGWGPGKEEYQVVVGTSRKASVVIPWTEDDFPENELAILEWLLEKHYADDTELSYHVDHLAGVPIDERKVEIGGNTYYAKHINPILIKHFGG